MTTDFPVGGPREPVYEALRHRGFVMGAWSDKEWRRADGMIARIYGAGSMLCLFRDDNKAFDGPMADGLRFIDLA